jgi:hypothetical protein
MLNFRDGFLQWELLRLTTPNHLIEACNNLA